MSFLTYKSKNKNSNTIPKLNTYFLHHRDHVERGGKHPLPPSNNQISHQTGRERKTSRGEEEHDIYIPPTKDYLSKTQDDD
jgi:hypothetical protein